MAWLTRLLAEPAHKKERQGGQGGPLLAERAHKREWRAGWADRFARASLTQDSLVPGTGG